MPLPDFQMFANRLRKMARHQGKWARRQGITCYRIYDADLPEFPLAVDLYEALPDDGETPADPQQAYLHVAEYRRDHPLTDEEYRLWRSGCRQVLCEVLDVAPERLFFKEREQQKGASQYQKREEQRAEIVVQENGLQFIVNLSDYLDTGLFLDHRLTRQQVRELAAGRRVLNLFAYTGSFTVYAAAGGAASTTTVDLSKTYLDWARRNLTLNGFDSPAHAFIQADVLAWLSAPPSDRFDLIVLDPPTFSNSKRMREVLDIQADHAQLILRCLDWLSDQGILFFSTNFRKFRLDVEQISEKAQIRDITAQTIPPDFRNKRIHYCFEIRKKGR